MAETNRTNSKVLIKSSSGLPLSFLPRQEANRAGSSWATRGVMGHWECWHHTVNMASSKCKNPREDITQAHLS